MHLLFFIHEKAWLSMVFDGVRWFLIVYGDPLEKQKHPKSAIKEFQIFKKQNMKSVLSVTCTMISCFFHENMRNQCNPSFVIKQNTRNSL